MAVIAKPAKQTEAISKRGGMNKFFSKDKDWVLLIGYVALIYVTLPFMPNIVYFFSSLLGQYFYVTATMMLIGIVLIIFTAILRRRPVSKNSAFYMAVAAVFALYLFFLLFATPIVAEKMHLIEYGFLSYLALRAVKGVKSHHIRYLLVVLIIIVVGYCDELIQKFTPCRYYELRDVMLNIISGVLGLFILKLLKPQRHSYD